MTTQFERDDLGDIAAVLPTVDGVSAFGPMNEVDASKFDLRLRQAGSGIPDRTMGLAMVVMKEIVPKLTLVTDGEITRFELNHAELAGVVAQVARRASAQTAHDIGEGIIESRALADKLEGLWEQSS